MRLPLATDITSRDGTLAKDSLMKNAFSEKVGEEFEVFKRPGLAQAFDLGAGQGQGLVSWKGTLFTARGNTLTQGPTATQVPDGAVWTLAATLAIGHSPSISNGAFNAYNSATDTMYGVNFAGGAANYYIIGASSSSNGTATGSPNKYRPTLCWFMNKLFVMGGDDNNFTAYQTVHTSTDGATFSAGTSGTWAARTDSSAVVFGSYMYLVSGRSGGGAPTLHADVWRTNDGVNWSQVTMPGGFLGRRDAALVVMSGTLYIIGGYDMAGVQVGDVWKTTDGTTWTQAGSALTLGTVGHQEAAGRDGRLLLASNAGVLGSNASASAWTVAAASPPFGNDTVIAAKTVSGVIYMLRANGSNFEWWAATNNAAGGDAYTLTGAADLPISFSQTSGAASTEYLFLKTTGKAWVLTFGQPGTLTQVTDADYPATTVPGSAYLDGYFFVMTTAGEIYNSALENPLSWGALDFISAEIEPDDAVALAKHQNYVVALKSTTTELFYDAANSSGSPLARLSNAAIQVGCANGYSIAALDAGLFFLSKFRSNQKSVHYFPKDGIQPVEIASPSIKRILTAADTSTVHCFAAQLNGHSFYVVTLPTEGMTLAYDLTTQTWSQWTFGTAKSPVTISSLTQSEGVATATATAHGFADGDPVTIAGATPSGYNGDVNIKYVDANTFTYPVSSALSSPATGTITATGWTEGYFPFGFYTNALSKDYIQHETSGKIYEISADYGDDAGAPIDLKVRTPPLNQGSIERKPMSRLAVVGDNTTGTLLVRYSDDDYVTFSKYRTIDLSTTNKQVRRLGDYRERALDFRYTGDNKIRIRSVDIE